jgi:hypothetical protein
MINLNVPDPNIIFDFNARVQLNLNLELVDLKLLFYRSLNEWMRATGLFSCSFIEFFDLCRL